MGVSVWDIEAVEDELTACDSPADTKKYYKVLGARTSEVFAATTSEPAVFAEELVALVHGECRKCYVTLRASVTVPAGVLPPIPGCGRRLLENSLRRGPAK
jgi:hypothetical protein